MSEVPRIPGAQLPLIGRAEALRALDAASSRRAPLVTVRGAVGVGKSALVKTWAHAAHDAVQVDLHECTSIAGLAVAIAEALQIAPPSAADDETALDRLATALLAREERVLVFDGVHGVTAAVTELLGLILADSGAPELVVTSRRSLGLPGEALVELRPLSVPEPGGELASSGAGQLWLECMSRASPGRVLDAEEQADVVHIVRAVDGLPLAIEMGVRRERLLGTRALRQKWVASAERDRASLAPLERALEASWVELGETERAVLADLTVFRGSWALESAERVLGDVGSPIAELVHELIDRSYLQLSRSGSEPRVRMLGVIRDDVTRRAGDARPGGDVRRRHAEECVRLSSTHTDSDPRPSARDTMARTPAISPEDLAAAFAWTVADGSAELALETLRALDLVHWIGGAPGAHLERLELMRARVDELDAGRAWRVWEMLGRWQMRLGDEHTSTSLELAVQLADEADDAEGIARSSRSLALYFSHASRPQEAVAAIELAVARASTRSETSLDRALLAKCVRTEATVRRRAGQGQRADEAYARALAAYSEIEDDSGRGVTLAEWSMHQLELGHRAEAQMSATRAIPLLERHGHDYLRAYLDAAWGIQAQVDGELEGAIELLETASVGAARNGDGRLDRICRGYLAMARLEQGVCEPASALDTLDGVDTRYAVPYGAVLRALLAFLLATDHDESLARVQIEESRSRPLPVSNFRLAVKVMTEGAEMVLASRSGAASAGESRNTASQLLEQAARGSERSGDGSAQAVSDLRLVSRLIEHWLEEKVDPAPILTLNENARLAHTVQFGVVDLRRRPLLARLLLQLTRAALTGAALTGAALTGAAPARDRRTTTDALLEAGWPGEKMVGSSGVRRLQVAINRLRDLGLREIIETAEGGYQLAEPWQVVFTDEPISVETS